MIPMTPEEYARNLVDRYNSLRKAVGDQNLYPIFLGAKISLSDLERRAPKVYAEVMQAYDLAEKELFPSQPTPSALTPFPMQN
jgi:hypothetical protein